MPRSGNCGIGEASRKADAVFQQSTVHNPYRANRIKSTLYDGKPVFTAILSGNGYFGQWQTFQHQCIGMLHRGQNTSTALANGRAALLPPPAFSERCHRGAQMEE